MPVNVSAAIHNGVPSNVYCRSVSARQFTESLSSSRLLARVARMSFLMQTTSGLASRQTLRNTSPRMI